MGKSSILIGALALGVLTTTAALADNGHCTLKPAKLPNGCMGVVGYNAVGDMVGFYRTAGRYAVLKAKKKCPATKFDVIENYSGNRIKIVNQAQLVLDDACEQASPVK